jgi:predicted nucleotidyltransferase
MSQSDYLPLLKTTLLTALNGYPLKIYGVGSVFHNCAGPASDIDVAVDPCGPLPLDLFARIREQFEESAIPFKVDLVDLSRTSPEFAEEVRSTGVLWKDC